MTTPYDHRPLSRYGLLAVMLAGVVFWLCVWGACGFPGWVT
jgi:hypothetical protein